MLTFNALAGFFIKLTYAIAIFVSKDDYVFTEVTIINLRSF